jgi:hypothetical protein
MTLKNEINTATITRMVFDLTIGGNVFNPVRKTANAVMCNKNNGSVIYICHGYIHCPTRKS